MKKEPLYVTYPLSFQPTDKFIDIKEKNIKIDADEEVKDESSGDRMKDEHHSSWNNPESVWYSGLTQTSDVQNVSENKEDEGGERGSTWTQRQVIGFSDSRRLRHRTYDISARRWLLQHSTFRSLQRREAVFDLLMHDFVNYMDSEFKVSRRNGVNLAEITHSNEMEDDGKLNNFPKV